LITALFSVSSSFADDANAVVTVPKNHNAIASADSIENAKKALAMLDEAESLLASKPQESLLIAQRVLLLIEAQQPRTAARAQSISGDAYSATGEFHHALGHYQQAIEKYKKLDDKLGIAESSLDVCNAQWHLSKYDDGLRICFTALKIFEEHDNKKGIADVLHNIGIIYDLLRDYPKALEYHHQALEIRRNIDDKQGIADSLNNIGIIYYFKNECEKGLAYLRASIDAWKAIDERKGAAKSLTNVGLCYKELKDYDKALDYSVQALKEWSMLNDKYFIASTSNNLGELYVLGGEPEKAIPYLKRALKIAQEMDIKELVRENYEYSSNLYASMNDYEKALAYYKKAADVKADIYSEENRKSIADMQTKYETEKKERELALLRKDNEIAQLDLERQELLRRALIGGLIMVFIVAFFIYNRYRFSQKVNRQLNEANAIIQKEKEKSDQLLLNVLPSKVAEDLKQTGQTSPDLFENVTVYFSDVVGFTNMSTALSPDVLISELNDIFTNFDNIIEQHGCERVKTIGDAYLCVCGMPVADPNHAENMVRAATEIVDYINKRNENNELQWRIRVGIHTGKVVGGVVGVKKYIYDVFGDTINTASRMESNSEPMRINISEATYELVKDKFTLTPRPVQIVKGKGEMKMYFVET
jgi:class 3 adenylate cyclase